MRTMYILRTNEQRPTDRPADRPTSHFGKFQTAISRQRVIRFTSTETALLRIRNDAFVAADKGMATIVVLLDRCAAFDTVDHQVMLQV